MRIKELRKPIAKTGNLIVQELSGDVLIYDLSSNKAFNLNETSGFIWQNCDGSKDVSALARAMTRRFNRPVNEEVIWLALEELKKENLVEYDGAAPAALAGLSRREAIRRVGLASMVALPMISALVAPTAANAGSVGTAPECIDPGTGKDIKKTPNRGTCNGHGNCCSNNCCLPAGASSGTCQPAGATC